MFIHFFAIAGGVFAAMLIGALVCHLVPQQVSDALCRAPGLDLAITYFTIAPLIVGPMVGGWIGLLAGVVGQVLGMITWEALHELVHREAMRGPRIVKSQNRRVGAVRNSVATWLTAIVTPVFWLIRLAEMFVYPWLTLLVGLPAYKHAEWVNVSRHKFNGLVGHDLIWCLYCDWMTGVWSLATEMLRNVESFWCPIRFYSDKKCANCVIDFPDIDNGWIPATGTMADVTAKLDEMYEPSSVHGWFGHPVRLTVRGQDVSENPSR